MHILSAIAKSKEGVTVAQPDEEDLAKYQTIVEQYNSKRLVDKQKANPTVLKSNRSQYEVKQEHKRSKVRKSSYTK